MRNRLFLVSIYMFAIGLFGCISSWSIFYVNWKVAQHDKTALGTVLKKTKIRNYSDGDVDYMIRYAFETAQGRKMNEIREITREAWKNISEGDEVTIIYSENTPERNFPKQFGKTLSMATPVKITAASAGIVALGALLLNFSQRLPMDPAAPGEPGAPSGPSSSGQAAPAGRRKEDEEAGTAQEDPTSATNNDKPDVSLAVTVSADEPLVVHSMGLEAQEPLKAEQAQEQGQGQGQEAESSPEGSAEGSPEAPEQPVVMDLPQEQATQAVPAPSEDLPPAEQPLPAAKKKAPAKPRKPRGSKKSKAAKPGATQKDNAA